MKLIFALSLLLVFLLIQVNALDFIDDLDRNNYNMHQRYNIANLPQYKDKTYLPDLDHYQFQRRRKIQRRKPNPAYSQFDDLTWGKYRKIYAEQQRALRRGEPYRFDGLTNQQRAKYERQEARGIDVTKPRVGSLGIIGNPLAG